VSVKLEHEGTGADPVVMDKKQFARRWGFSTRMVDKILAAGMPHLKFGLRRVRLITEEADAWIKERYGTRRNGPSDVAQVLHGANPQSSKPARKARRRGVSAR
jgi:hypothetical protein